MSDKNYDCLVCGKEQTAIETVYADLGTPIANNLNLDENDANEGEGWVPVCDNCYNRGCKM